MDAAPASSALARMDALLARWEAVGDRRVVFLGCYRLMTLNMLTALAAGEFQDPAWVRGLLERFAAYYFEALEAYEAGGAGPRVWQLTHTAARDPATRVLQNLLLGVNAHICYDLALALVERLEDEWPGLTPAQRTGRRADHDHVNAVIARTVDAVQDTVVERYAPRLDLLDVALGPLDEWLASSLIAHWRTGVWEAAMRLLAAGPGSAREAVRLTIEAHTMRRAEILLLRP